MKRLEDLPPVVTPDEVAEALRCNVDLVRNLITEKRLRATNIGRGARPCYRIQRGDLISFIQGDTNQAA